MGLLDQAKQTTTTESPIDNPTEAQPTGLLDLALQQQPTTFEETDHDIEVIEEQGGYGYHGLASRRIVYDHTNNEYRYEVAEPNLNTEETKVKKELAHLFKMVADIDTFGMLEEEKSGYLQKTIEQIIIDNDIKIEPKPEKQGFTLPFLKKNQEENETSNEEQTTTETSEPTGLLALAQQQSTPLESEEENTQTTEAQEDIQTEEKTSFLAKLGILPSTKEPALPPEERINEESREKIYYHIFRDFLGYGRIDILMQDEGIEDISCDGAETPIFLYHRKYEAIETNINYDEDLELNSFLIRLCQLSGKQISIYSPIVDGKLPDGSRLQATLARTVTRGSTFTIRKFKENPLTPIDLINYNSINVEMAAYFWMAIENGASILFCGGTASGKTTALNALLLFVPATHKIISIEDTREVNIPHKNWIAGTTRKGFSTSDEAKTGKDIDMFDLIRAALRQRPRVIIVGEVRGREAYSLFQAMATGHTAYATVHASDIHTLIQRLENPPIGLPRALLTSLDIIVFQNAVTIGGKMVRRMTSVTEIIKLDSDTNQLIFMAPFTWLSKIDDRFVKGNDSKIISKIKENNDWTNEQLQNELDNRKTIINWMVQQKVDNYVDFGRIINEYSKFPENVLERARKDLQQSTTQTTRNESLNQTDQNYRTEEAEPPAYTFEQAAPQLNDQEEEEAQV